MELPEHLFEPIGRVATTFPEVRAIYIFGSQAVGGARPDSDLDLGVLYRTGQALATTLRLEQDFEQETARKIHLIDLGRASAFLALDIVRGMVAAGDSYLRRALEALLDLARHVLAKGFGRAPAECGEVARQLGEVGVVNSELAARLSLMAGYRSR